MAVSETHVRRLNVGDPELNVGRGLRARAQKDGTVSWIFMKHMKGRTSPVRRKLGSFPDMNMDDAEEKARKYRRLIADGIHPDDYENERREQLQLEKAQQEAHSITLQTLLENYEKSREIYSRGKAPRTMKDRRNAITSVFREWLDKPIQKITKQIVEDKIFEWKSQRGARTQVLKTIRYLSAMMNYAKGKNIIAENPCDVLKGNISKGATREVREFLEISESVDLLDHIGHLIDEHLNGHFLHTPYNLSPKEITPTRLMMFEAIALELLTGLRKREVLGLRWEDVHLDEPDGKEHFKFIKSKQQEAMGVPITEPMKGIFERRLRDKRNDYVFSSPRKDNAPISDERGAMDTLNKLIPNLKSAPKIGSQVLRKTFATAAYSLGYSLEQIGLFTGHTSAIANTKVATQAYVTRQAESHRSGFQTINMALMGEVPDEFYLQAIPQDEADDFDEYMEEDGN